MRAEVSISEIIGRGTQRNHLGGLDFKFYPGWKENKKETEKEGRLICDPVHMIQVINFAGEKTDREVEDRDKRAYPEVWAHYLESFEAPKSGTPLVEWPLLIPAKLAELIYLGYRTVEQVADISEDQTKQVPALIEFKRMASNWIEAAGTTQAEVTKLKEQVVKSKRAYGKLEEQYNFAMRRIESEIGSSSGVN